MSAFSPEVSDPARWPDRSFLDGEVERARTHVPAFDPDATPTSMHAIPECFRRWPGTPRGPHPHVSECALRPLADGIVAPHPFQDAGLLVLGVGFNRPRCCIRPSRWRRNRRDKVRHILSGDGVERRWVEAVACSRADGEEWFGYAGGWPKDGGVVIVDRIRAGRGGSAELLGGAHVGAHVRGVLGGAEPPGRAMTMRDAPVQ